MTGTRDYLFIFIFLAPLIGIFINRIINTDVYRFLCFIGFEALIIAIFVYLHTKYIGANEEDFDILERIR